MTLIYINKTGFYSPFLGLHSYLHVYSQTFRMLDEKFRGLWHRFDVIQMLRDKVNRFLLIFKKEGWISVGQAYHPCSALAPCQDRNSADGPHALRVCGGLLVKVAHHNRRFSQEREELCLKMLSKLKSFSPWIEIGIWHFKVSLIYYHWSAAYAFN